MTEIKEAPKPETTDGQGSMKDIAPRARRAPREDNYSPFAFMRRFADELDRPFEDYGIEGGWPLPRVLTRGHELLRREAGSVPAEWSPQVDILEREGQFIVRADLPATGREDVQVEVTDDVLTIRGERKHEKTEDRKG